MAEGRTGDAERPEGGRDGGRPPQRPPQLPVGSWRAAVKRTVRGFQVDNLSDWAAALTYYGVLSIFPALLVLISLVDLAGRSNDPGPAGQPWPGRARLGQPGPGRHDPQPGVDARVGRGATHRPRCPDATRVRPRPSRDHGGGGGDGATMQVDAKGNQLIVICETPDAQEAA